MVNSSVEGQALAKGLRDDPDGIPRCFWHNGYEDYIAYHDNEWGRPVADDIRLFEKVALEGFQSGLSWLTILRKRENFRAAFAGFDPAKIAKFDDGDVERLLADSGIVRHRGKIEAVINNAKLYAPLRREFGSLAAFMWQHEPKDEIAEPTYDDLMALTIRPEAAVASKALKKRGWRFVGPTTVTALFQAAGLANDHIHGCAFRDVVTEARAAFKRPV